MTKVVIRRVGPANAAAWAGLAVLLLCSCACVHHLPRGSVDAALPLPEEGGAATGGLGGLALASLAGAASLAVAALLGWGGRLRRGTRPLDREDLALLRTARDALRLLLQKQLAHLRPRRSEGRPRETRP